jgi:hypothetical protein
MRCFYIRVHKARALKEKILTSLKESSSEGSIMNKLAQSTWGGYGSPYPFFMEVIAFIPLDAFDYFWGHEIYFLRVLKILRLGLITKYSDKVIRFLGQRNIQTKASYMRLVRDVFVTIYTSHFFGCIFMFIAHEECGFDLDHTKCIASWAISDNLSGMPVIHQYARALYWGTINVIPLGFGDISPRTDAEFFFNTLLAVCGVMCQNQLIANFSFIFSSSGIEYLLVFVILLENSPQYSLECR